MHTPDPLNTKKEGDRRGKDKIATEAKRRRKGYYLGIKIEKETNMKSQRNDVPCQDRPGSETAWREARAWQVMVTPRAVRDGWLGGRERERARKPDASDGVRRRGESPLWSGEDLVGPQTGNPSKAEEEGHGRR